MTSGPAPLWVIYGDPFAPSLAKFVEWWPELGHLWPGGWTPMPAVCPHYAYDLPIAQDAVWWAQPVVMLDPMAR